MSVGDEGLEPINEDVEDVQDDARGGPIDDEDEGGYEDEEFYEEENTYLGLEEQGATAGELSPGMVEDEPEHPKEMTEKEKDVKELMDLQRKYRMMMGDRSSFKKHAQSKIRQQSSHLGRLQSENTAMKEELGSHVPASGLERKISSQTAQMNKLTEEEDKVTRLYASEVKRAGELNKQGEFLSKKMKAAREVTGPSSSRDSQAFIMKQVRVLENRLDKALVKYNEALSNNKKLRSNIDDLRREKNVYDGIYKKLERDLNEKKRVMADIIEMSNQSYEARDQSEHEIELIKRQMREREELWEAELKQLNRKLESFERVTKLMGDDAHRGSLTVDQETKMKKKVRANAWKLGGQMASNVAKKDLTETFEEMFLRIRLATKITDIDVIVESFIEAEDRNFSLFNYVNELTMEVEKLEEGIGEHQAELEKELDDDATVNTRSKKIIKELEDKLVKTEAKAEHYETKLRQITEEMDVSYNVVESLFSRLGCEKLANTEILGSGGVGESNIMLYLGVIEQRTNDVMNSFLMRDVVRPTQVSQPVAPSAPTAPTAPSVARQNKLPDPRHSEKAPEAELAQDGADEDPEALEDATEQADGTSEAPVAEVAAEANSKELVEAHEDVFTPEEIEKAKELIDERKLGQNDDEGEDLTCSQLGLIKELNKAKREEQRENANP